MKLYAYLQLIISAQKSLLIKSTLRSFQNPYCGPVPVKLDLNWAAAAISAAWLDKPPWGRLLKLEFDPSCEGVNIGWQPSGRLLVTPVEVVLDTEVTEVELFGFGDGDAELSSSGVSSDSISVLSAVFLGSRFGQGKRRRGRPLECWSPRPNIPSLFAIPGRKNWKEKNTLWCVCEKGKNLQLPITEESYM